jgi:hypothetical protein
LPPSFACLACVLAQTLAQSCAIELFRKASKVIRNRGGYWQVKVYAGLDPLTGQQRYEYDRAKTKREAVRVEAALKTKVAEGRSRGTAARTVADPASLRATARLGVCRAYGAMSTRRIASTRRPTSRKPACCARGSLAKSSA